MKRFVFRHQPHASLKTSILAGVGAMLAVAAFGLLSDVSQTPWLFAPFAATCVLIFGFPSSALSQPANVIGGHMVSALIGLGLHLLLANHFAVAGLAVGLSISVMMIARIAHPPAGATALVAYLTASNWMFLVMPVLTGSVALVVMGMGYHLAVKAAYPHPLPVQSTTRSN
ncbi:MAG: HPP family protein [Alphaproteobacteria bacterium]|nr:HPP family protein [Alphaproteobacteria bacterium]